MKLTKSDLKEMIRECVQEELGHTNLKEGAVTDAVKGLFGKKAATSAPMTWDQIIYAADDAIALIQSRTDNQDFDDFEAGWDEGEEYGYSYTSEFIYHTKELNEYDNLEKLCAEYSEKLTNMCAGRFVVQLFCAEDNSSNNPNKSSIGYNIANVNIANETVDENLNEAATGFRITGPALLSIEDLADAVYRDNDSEAIKKYASDSAIQDVTADDLHIAADNSDLSREIKYLAAHMKNKGVATIGEFAATLAEALSEDVNTMDWDTLIDKADELLYELIKVSGNAEYDDADGYWSGEEGHIWTNRYLYYTDKLNDSTRLEKLCDEYSRKLPNVSFYSVEDDFLDDPISEIGYEATNINY